MGIELYWDNDEQTVMLMEVEGRWTWEELFETLSKVKKVTDRADYEIGAIVDMRDGMQIPGGSLFNPSNLENAKKVLQMGDDGTGPVVFVGKGVVKTIYNSLRGMNPRASANIHFADSVDAARAYLEDRAATKVS
jgi:hypothetical protein